MKFISTDPPDGHRLFRVTWVSSAAAVGGGGLCMLAQSSDRPRRTTNALVNAAKTMALAAIRTNNPVNDARRSAPLPSLPPFPPPPQPRSVGGAGGP